MIDLTAPLPVLAFPALALPAALVLSRAARRSLRWRFKMLPPERYQVVHDPALPATPDGDLIQHAIISRYGVFLVQVLDRAGRIEGGPDDKLWIQQFAGGSSAFHNPLRVGRRRAAVLAAMMGIDTDALFTIVVFTGRCTFGQAMPANLTTPGGCLTYLRARREVRLGDAELERIRARLEKGLPDPQWQALVAQTMQARRERVRVAAEEAKAQASALVQAPHPVCPRCGAALGAYSYKTGARAGQMFSGCTRFPACGYRAYPMRKNAEPMPATA
jgi:hypothetical protein